MQTTYLITVGEPDINGVMSDDFEETLVFVGRLIEQLNKDENNIGKCIYVSEYELNHTGKYVKKENGFCKNYQISLE